MKAKFLLGLAAIVSVVAIAAATVQHAQAHPTDLVGVQKAPYEHRKPGLVELLLAGALALGTVLTAATSTDERLAEVLYLPMAATTKIYAGALVAVDSSGRAVNAADTATLRVIGRAEETVDNTSGAAADLYINVKRGCFRIPNSGTQPVTAAYVGKPAYVEDNNTVAITTTNKIVAGRVIEVETAGVWIDTRHKAVPAAVADTIGAAVATTAATNSSPYGYSQAQADAIVARLNELRTAVLALQTGLNG